MKATDKQINKVVDLWCEKLKVPVFDNGDNSDIGFLTMAMATVNIDNDKPDDMLEKIEALRTSLTTELKRLRDNPGDREYFPYQLSTDYHPCRHLAKAAEEVGIPSSQFSCKSSVGFDEHGVSSSFGYGAGYTMYYDIPEGWLVTTLRGTETDIAGLLALARTDCPSFLKIETEDPATS